jgi:hypothetical protein
MRYRRTRTTIISVYWNEEGIISALLNSCYNALIPEPFSYFLAKYRYTAPEKEGAVKEHVGIDRTPQLNPLNSRANIMRLISG